MIMTHSLPTLPYEMDALAPRMSRETLEYHYGKHLKTYIDNLNNLIAGSPFAEMPLEEICVKAEGPIFNNGAQAWNHIFFFNSFSPSAQAAPSGALADAIDRDFGSLEAFKEQFGKAATTLFGSGWVWLCADKEGKLSIVAEPNAGTTLSEFWFTGFENATTTITADTITVTLPYGTDLNKTEYTYLIPNFDFTADSEGAIVTVDDPALLGKPLRSGVTNVNFTTTRKITVIAENENATRQYTVNVVVADAFSDVTPDNWFYNDVMAAAGFGYVNGMGNGKYEPYGTTTRAQFAKILAEALDYDPTAYTTSAFPDVANDHWAMAAIAFCADREIILGYDTGNFEPNKTITRQEAALMLQRAFDLQGTESTQYPDDAKIAGWAEDGVYAVKHAGLMKGDADTGNFRPTSTMNRAEMATILMNAHRAGLIK